MAGLPFDGPVEIKAEVAVRSDVARTAPCAAALEVQRIIGDDNLLANVRTIGIRLEARRWTLPSAASENHSHRYAPHLTD
jgi:hypothetical protein